MNFQIFPPHIVQFKKKLKDYSIKKLQTNFEIKFSLDLYKVLEYVLRDFTLPAT